MFGSLVIIMLNFQNCEIYKKANENIKIKRMSKEKLYKVCIIYIWILEKCILSKYIFHYSFDKSFFWINIEYNRKNLT